MRHILEETAGKHIFLAHWLGSSVTIENKLMNQVQRKKKTPKLITDNANLSDSWKS